MLIDEIKALLEAAAHRLPRWLNLKGSGVILP